MNIPESDVRIKVTNDYAWKNYNAGMEFSVSNKTKQTTVKTCSTDTLRDVIRKIINALEE